MHPNPDHSAAYVVLETDGDLQGHGFTFTIGRGNDLCVAAMDALGHRLVGLDVRALERDMGDVARLLTQDTQLRWLGPEKGVIHLAAGALVNASTCTCSAAPASCAPRNRTSPCRRTPRPSTSVPSPGTQACHFVRRTARRRAQSAR